jgi:hypothetical protein|tara:strand:+ start:310 stop:576 length:267 start_codon:yes stop_codon:yes gene_type:complete
MNLYTKQLIDDLTARSNLNVEVVEILYHSIKLNTLLSKPWGVYGHGANGFIQLIDSYDDLASAQKDYPEAWCSWKETQYVDCIADIDF